MTPEDVEGLIITVTDVRQSNLCASGFKQWFIDVGLEARFKEFVKQGLPAEVIMSANDGWGKLVVEQKLQRMRADG